MSSEHAKNLPQTSRPAEEQYLSETLTLIQNNIEKYGHDVTAMRDQIDDMLEHFHDDNPELINTLENTLTMHDHMKRALERNEKALSKPYFGRIIFHDEALEKDESIYIGRGGIAKDSNHQAVVDWRAPVANAYYENGLGKCSYPSPDGKPINIDLLLKRTYEIENSKLLGYFDSEVIANDDLLTKYLAKNKQAVLGEIVATIQKEQNDIIRKTPYHNFVVQGVAGSGKTTVAMHRISFILYNYADRFKPDDFYIVGSNRILLNYITGVLPDLDVYGVRQMTMEQLFIRLLYEDWDEKQYGIKSTDRSGTKGIVKGSLSWFRSLEDYCRRLEWNTILRESIYLNPRQFVEGIRDGKNGVYDETNGEPANPKDLIQLVDGDAVTRYIRQNPTVSVQNKINMLNERLSNKIKEEFLGKGVKYTDAEKKAIAKAYRNRYGQKEWKKSIFAMYTDFLKEQISRGYDVDIPDKEFDVYDLAALAYLYKRIKETEIISEAHHVVIDEAQDFGMMAYSVLKFCIKDCTYTIMGDVSQNIHFGYGLNDWEDLKRLYLSDPKSSFGILKKSYRNTIEISDFATRILKHGQFSIYPVEPIIRHGKPVDVRQTAGYDALIQGAADTCKAWQKKGLDTIAIVCRNQESASQAAAQLSSFVEIMESDLEKAEFGNGIMVLPVEYTKGLEFDAVLILAPTREDYPADDGHAKLLYVAATRALHELCILHTGNLTGLIADPIPDRAPETAAVSDSDSSGINAKPGRVSYAAQPHPVKPIAPKPRIVISTPKAAAPTPGLQTDYTGLRKASQPVRPRAVTGDFVSGIPAPGAAAKSSGVPAPGKTSNSPGVPAPGKNSNSPGTPSFGDMPATSILRPVGHPRLDLAIRWVSRQTDGLYLQSRYGILRLTPVGSAIIRVTFAKGNRLTDGIHPGICVKNMYRMWQYRDTAKTLELLTDELSLQVDKTTRAIQFLTRDKKPLLAERSRDCRQIENSPSGGIRSWLYLDWKKSENLYGLDANVQLSTNLRGSARYLSHEPNARMLPFVLSDQGYGILPAAVGSAFLCDISSYGSYIYMENTSQMDYYFVAGKRAETILSAYSYLCGKL